MVMIQFPNAGENEDVVSISGKTAAVQKAKADLKAAYEKVVCTDGRVMVVMR